jgi:hypothetical protein
VVVVGGSASAGFGDAGTLWLLDLNTIGSPTGDEWFLENSGQLRVPTASPTVGYIPIQDNSGGMDRVVYVPTAPENSTSAGLTSVWLGSVGEQPTQVTLSGSTLRVRTRAALNGMPLVFSSGPSSYGIRISLVFPDGTPAADGVYSSVINGNPSSTGVPGEFQVDVNPGSFDLDQSTPDPSDDLSLRVDYTVDWGQAQGGSANADTFVRGRVGFPDTSARSRQVVGNLALAPSGNVIAVVSDPSGSTPGGAIYNLFENGRGVFNVAYRWDLHDRITIDRQNGDPLELGPAVLDEDPLSQDIGAGEFNGLHFVSGAAVRDGLAYVMAQGSRPLNNFGGVNAPAGVIMAFEADPEPVQFTIPAAAAEGIGLNDEENPNLVLAQPDLARSTNTSDPEIDTILGNVVLEKSPAGSIRVTLPSLSQSQRGDLNSVLSTSLPVLVRVTNPVGEIAVLPEAAGGSTDITLSGTDSGSFVTGRASGRFTPLAWYAVMNGFQGQATPAVGGRTLYVTGASVLPGIIATGNPFSPRGSLYAFDTQTNAANRFVNPNSDRPWMPQLYFVLRDGPGPFNYEAAEPVLWPQIDGIDDFDDLRIRILQTSVDGSESYNLAVGDGTVSITADDALYSFRQSNFLVVDEGRVSMFDPAGNPLWSTDQTLGSGQILPATSASNYTRLSRPTRLYPSEQDGFWIVDTGNDRVVRIDSAGRERRLIKQLQTSPYYVPRGWREGSRRVLRQPMDVLTYTTTRGAAEVAAAFPGEIQVNPDGSRTAPGSPRAAELWRHAIVADAGNRRIVEVVDRYWLTPDGQIEELVRYADPDTDEVIPALNVVWWHTPEELTGSNYRYSSLGRAQVGSGPDRRSVIGFGFSNVEPGRATFDAGTQTQDVYSGNSGIVLFDENTGQSQVITEFGLPAIPGGAFLADTGGITLDQSPLNSFTFNSPARAETARPISGLRSLTLSYVPDGSGGYTLAAMFTDNTGVYEVWDPEGDGLWSVRWMMPEEAFLGLRRPQGGGPFDRGNLRRNPSRFAPTYAERLNLSEVIVVNGYLGETLNGADYTGEVVLLEGAPGAAAGYDPSRPNLGFSPLSVKFELPPVQNIRGIVNPVFAQRQ